MSVSRMSNNPPSTLLKPGGKRILALLPVLITLSLSIPAEAFDVGVNYHAHTSDFPNDNFLTEYHTAGIRTKVKTQLQEMANAGVDHIFTRLFIGAPAGSLVSTRPNRYLMAFPPTDQDLRNLANYVDDVKAKGLTLDLGFIWLGQADFEVGCVQPTDDGTGGCQTAGLGHGHQSVTTFKFNARETVRLVYSYSIIDPISAGDVRNFYFDTEAQYDPNPTSLPIGSTRRIRRNQNWFFENVYGYFSAVSENHSTDPTVYFVFTIPNGYYPGGVLNNTWHNLPDPQFPITQGHRTMFNAYRAVKFVHDTIKKKNWPSSWLPPRFDLSIYTDTNNSSEYSPIICRIVQDAKAVIVDNLEFNFNGRIAAAEMGFLGDCERRRDLWNALQGQGLESVSFWTTLYSTERQGYGNLEWSHITDFDGGSNDWDQNPNTCGYSGDWTADTCN